MERSPTMAESPARTEDEGADVRQYTLAEILGVWAAAAIPMGILAWVVAPLLEDQLSGEEPLGQALLIVITLGLVWQFFLVLILMRRELGTLAWPRLREALWLRTPRDPKTGRVGGRVWLWALLFMFLLALWQFVPLISGPSPRDFGEFLSTDRGEDFFRDAWGWFALVVVFSIFNSVLGEELLFRGVLLPRMRGVFGRRDWLANAVLFAVYHLHQPWGMPRSLVNGMLYAYSTQRFRSAWMGILIHSLNSLFIIIVVLVVVLR